MAGSFRGARSKLKRADTHIADAEKLIAVFLASVPFEMKRELVAVKGVEQLALRAVKEVPCDLEPIAADAIHNLRAALDLMMCDLWRLNHATNIANAKFPFTKKAESFQARLIEMTSPLPQRDRDIIAKYKPYRGGDDLLWSLHEMDISDKHREIVAVGGAIPNLDGWLEVRPLTGKNFTMARDLLQACEAGEPWLTFEPGSEVKFDLTISCDVAFKEFHGVSNYSVSAALREFRRLVTSIVSELEQAYAADAAAGR